MFNQRPNVPNWCSMVTPRGALIHILMDNQPGYWGYHEALIEVILTKCIGIV